MNDTWEKIFSIVQKLDYRPSYSQSYNKFPEHLFEETDLSPELKEFMTKLSFCVSRESVLSILSYLSKNSCGVIVIAPRKYDDFWDYVRFVSLQGSEFTSSFRKLEKFRYGTKVGVVVTNQTIDMYQEFLPADCLVCPYWIYE